MDLENPGDINESLYELEMRKDSWNEIAKKNGFENSMVQPINADMLNEILRGDQIVLM